MKTELKRLYNKGYIIDIYNFKYINNSLLSEMIRLDKNFKNYLLDNEENFIKLNKEPEKIIDIIIDNLFFNNKKYLLTQFNIDKINKIIDISFNQL